MGSTCVEQFKNPELLNLYYNLLKCELCGYENKKKSFTNFRNHQNTKNHLYFVHQTIQCAYDNCNKRIDRKYNRTMCAPHHDEMLPRCTICKQNKLYSKERNICRVCEHRINQPRFNKVQIALQPAFVPLPEIIVENERKCIACHNNIDYPETTAMRVCSVCANR